MPESPLLALQGLNAFYGDVPVLRDIHLQVYPKEVVSIIGPNGAGKSTLLRAVMGLVQMGQNGREPAIRFQGRPLDGLATEAIVRRGISLVPEGARVFPEMTCLDNLKLGAYALKDKRRLPGLLNQMMELFPRLRERAGQKARTMSGGERQMLAIGRALMSMPRFLLLDEPSLGLHPLMVSRIFETIHTINRQGLTVLLVEQKVGFALDISHRGYVMENGRIVLAGTGKELLQNPHVRKAYLSV